MIGPVVYTIGGEELSFEWDEDKRRANLAKHGVDFPAAAKVFGGHVLVFRDPRHGGEDRWVVFGLLGEHVIALACTWRGEHCRIISARWATNREEEAYFRDLPA